MEEAVYKELKALCAKIMNAGEGALPAEYLTAVRELEEKLILLDYLHYRQQSLQSKAELSVSLDQEITETIAAAEKQKQVTAPSSVDVKVATEPEQEVENEPEPEAIVPAKEIIPDFHEEVHQQSTSINENLGKGLIKLGLNDRIAFTKHLFDQSQEDLNRVVSQLNTFGTLAEAENFINDMVKPDYNWGDHEEYEERFRTLIRARFGKE